VKYIHGRLAQIFVAGAVVATTLVVSGSVTQSASARCQDPYVSYRVWVIRGIHKPFPDLVRFKDGPGGTIEGSVSKTDTLAATFGVATSVEADGIFAKAKAEVSASVSRSVSATIGHRYTHNIKPGKYGHLAYGSWSKKIGWKKIWHTSLCDRKVLKRGKAVLPTRSVGWHFWQTDH
jgi:hypothetical protein